MNTRTDCDIAHAVSAISIAPDPKACSRIFLKAIAAFKIDTFACGEVDLAVPERTVFRILLPRSRGKTGPVPK